MTALPSHAGSDPRQPEEPGAAVGPLTLLSDTFDDDTALGAVLGSRSRDGTARGGVDVEGCIGIDNGALRMRPLRRPGWGREGLAYGPVLQQPGLVASVQVLNGHHASQTFYLPETRRQVLRRWAGSLRRGRWPARPHHHENLAVGLFGSTAPSDPLRNGHGLVVHAVTADNGELWAGVCGRPLRVLTGLQNLPLAVTVVLRETGAIYFAATVGEDPDLPELPRTRPLAIDPSGTWPELHLGVHQRILGEVGYRIDTRVYRTDVAVCPELATWCTTATVADRFVSGGPVSDRRAERGGLWAAQGRLHCGRDGLAGEGSLELLAGGPAGLVHALVRAPRGGEVELLLRAHGPASPALRLRVGTEGALLLFGTSACAEELARSTSRLRPGHEHSLQVLDDGRTISAHLDGVMLFDGWSSESRSAAARGVGVSVQGGARVRDLEVHPRSVPAPVASEPAWPATLVGQVTRFDEDFVGRPGPLDAAVTDLGGRRWERVEGNGRLDLVDGGGARVRATPDAPNPGRTIYAVPWEWPHDVDLRVTLLPPGSARGQRHNCRGGLVLYQDPENYLVVNVWLDDWLGSTSVSTFYRVGGHEDMHDAVWTLTGDRVTWGVPFELRVAFDGERFTAYLDGRPTLYRAVRDVYPDAPRMEVRRLGLIANEEWGDDTGTTFLRLLARTQGEGPPLSAPHDEDP